MSDWGFGKKLNSQIADVPLNHLIWLNDYKTYGENSYVFQNKNILHELYESPISIWDFTVLSNVLDYANGNNKIGKVMSNLDCINVTSPENMNILENLLSNYGVFKQINDNGSLYAWREKFYTIDVVKSAMSALKAKFEKKRISITATGDYDIGSDGKIVLMDNVYFGKSGGGISGATTTISINICGYDYSVNHSTGNDTKYDICRIITNKITCHITGYYNTRYQVGYIDYYELN